MAYYYPRKEVIELMNLSHAAKLVRLAPRIESGDPAFFEDWNALENLYDTIFEREKRSRKRFGIVERV